MRSIHSLPHVRRTASTPMRAGPLSLALASSATLTALTDTPSATLSLSSPYIPLSHPSPRLKPRPLTPPHAAVRASLRWCTARQSSPYHPPCRGSRSRWRGRHPSVLGAARAEREALVRAALQLAALPLLRPLRHVLQERRRVEQPPARLALWQVGRFRVNCQPSSTASAMISSTSSFMCCRSGVW